MTALVPLGDSIRINPRGHGSRVGLGFLGNGDAFPLRDLLGIGASGTGITLNDWPSRSPATIRGTSVIKLCGR
jgi:hypothetical protein